MPTCAQILLHACLCISSHCLELNNNTIVEVWWWQEVQQCWRLQCQPQRRLLPPLWWRAPRPTHPHPSPTHPTPTQPHHTSPQVCGAELFTGNTALLPAAVYEGKATVPQLIKNW